jgi:hypothetical protein
MVSSTASKASSATGAARARTAIVVVPVTDAVAGSRANAIR